MIIRVKTTLIEIDVKDTIDLGGDDYLKRDLPELPACIKSVIEQAIKLHQEVAKTR